MRDVEYDASVLAAVDAAARYDAATKPWECPWCNQQVPDAFGAMSAHVSVCPGLNRMEAEVLRA